MEGTAGSSAPDHSAAARDSRHVPDSLVCRVTTQQQPGTHGMSLTAASVSPAADGSFWTCPSTLKMDAICCSETSHCLCRERRHIPDGPTTRGPPIQLSAAEGPVPRPLALVMWEARTLDASNSRAPLQFTAVVLSSICVWTEGAFRRQCRQTVTLSDSLVDPYGYGSASSSVFATMQL
jgi:hypothetical protein